MKRKFSEGDRPSPSFQRMYHDDAVARFLDERVNEQPKLELFVSHSVAQRQFAELLCRDLEAANNSVFFDKESDSVAKREESVASTLKAARECRLGILLLSDEFFTKSKWPMMELVTFVASRAAKGKQVPGALGHVLEPRLLPVYYKLIRPVFKHPARQACWFRKWEEWAKEDPRVDVKIWKEALRAIDGHKSIDPQLLELKGDDAFRREIVKKVTDFNIRIPLRTVSPVAARVAASISPPALPMAADSTPVVLAGRGTRVVSTSEQIIVNGIIRWCEGINGLFSSASDLTQKTGAHVMGIYGMSGMGKSTLAKTLCKYYREEFGGRVCHLELKIMVLLDLQKKVLQDLSLLRSQQTLDGIADAVQAWNALDVGMKEQDKVFLVIDNIWDDQSFIPERFLKMKFAPGSKLLLLARSMPILLRVGVPVNCCENMPFLRDEEAMAIFIIAGGCQVNDEDQTNVRKWVSHCCFGLNNTNVDRFQYHPLAIKVLANATTAAMGRKPSNWTDDILNFKLRNQSVNQVFKVLRLGFGSLPSVYRPVFVSLILFAPGRDYASIRSRMGVHSVENVCRWLAIVHDMSENRALAFLQAMEENLMVVEKWQDTSKNLRIHDLYREFAEHEFLQGQYRASHVVFNNDKNIPEALKIEKPDSSQRHALYELSKELRVMKVEDCSQLKTLDLEYMALLRCLVVEGCPKLEKIIGLKAILGNLAWLQWNCCNLFLVDVPLPSELQVLRLEGGYFNEGKGPQQEFLVCQPPEVNLCKGMRELSLTKFPQLERAPELFNLSCLEILIFNECGRLKHIPNLSVLSHCLRSLHLCGCASLQRIPGLENLIALLQLELRGCSNLVTIPDLQHLNKLEFLDLSATGIREIPGIPALHELEELHLNSCKNLLKFPDLSSLHKLKKIFWRGCQVRRDGVMVSESTETSQGKRAPFEEESDENRASGKNSNSTDEKSGEADSDGEASDIDDDDEVESEHEDGEEEDAYESEEDEEGAAEDEYADEDGDDDGDGDGDGDDENSTDTDSDADSG